MTDLFQAIQNRDQVKVIAYLCKDVKLLCSMHDGHTPLSFASKHGYGDMVDTLLICDQNVNVANGSNYTSLMIASAYGHMDVVKSLLGAGANPNLRNSYGETALILAAERGRVEVLETLSKNGADGNCVDMYGYNALYATIKSQQYAATQCLVKNGLNINSKPYITSILKDGLWVDILLEQIRVLLDLGANPNQHDGIHTPLHIAIDRYMHPVMELLLAHGADPHHSEGSFISPLMYAGLKGDKRAVEIMNIKKAP